MDPLLNFPKDIAILTFSNLDSRDLCNCMKMNRVWRAIASDDSVWKGILLKQFPQLLPVIPKDVKVYHYFSAHAVSNLDDLISRIGEFIIQGKLEENRSLTCFFPPTLPHCIVNIEFGYYSIPTEKGAVDKKEYLVFTGKLPTDRTFFRTFCSTEEINQINPCIFDRHEYGLNSRLIVSCRLITEEITESFKDRVGYLPQNSQILQDHYNALHPVPKVKKKGKWCIIA